VSKSAAKISKSERRSRLRRPAYQPHTVLLLSNVTGPRGTENQRIRSSTAALPVDLRRAISMNSIWSGWPGCGGQNLAGIKT